MRKNLNTTINGYEKPQIPYLYLVHPSGEMYPYAPAQGTEEIRLHQTQEYKRQIRNLRIQRTLWIGVSLGTAIGLIFNGIRGF